MKPYTILFIMLYSLGALAQSKNQNSFTVKGQLLHGSKVKLYLTEAKLVSNTLYHDSATTDTTGNFSFTGSIPEPRAFTLTIAGQRRMMDRISFFVEQSAVISVNGYSDSLALAKVTGSNENTLLKQFSDDFKKKLPVFMKNRKLYTEAKSKNDSVAMEREGKISDRKNIDEVVKMVTAFVTEHPSSSVSIELAEMLLKYSRMSTADSLLRIVEKTRAGKYAAAQKLREILSIQKSVMKGAVAPDFSLPDTTGRNVALSSLRGKYVLVDFWASWCGPCRAENPNVLQAYNKFQDKNFTIVAVSLDNNKSSWLKAIKDDSLPWIQLSDLKGFDNKVAKQYGVKSIPSNFLIDPSGKIVALNLRGKDLEKALELNIR